MNPEPVRLSHIVDFYYLLALDHALTSKNQFHRPTARLVEDCKRELESLTTVLGTAIRDYLYIASCGEARHARSCTRGNYIPTIEPGASRASVCRDAANYPPTIDNMSKVQQLFESFDWRGSYGGLRWRDIIASAILFESLDLSSFIDHIVDVYHNGGRLFDKSSAAEVAMLSTDITRHTIQSFLDYKRDYDILHEVILDSEPIRIRRMISRRVARLLARYYRIVHNADLPNWLQGNGSSSYCFAVNLQWGDKQHADIVTTRDGSSDYIPRRRIGSRVCWDCGYEAYSGEGQFVMSNNHNLYCEDCYYEKFGSCYQCNEETRVDKLNQQDYELVCDYCAIQCPSCFEIVEQTDNMVEYNNEAICEHCYDNILESCDYCGDYYEPEQVLATDSGLVTCEQCAERRRAGLKTINPTIDYNESNYAAAMFPPRTKEPRKQSEPIPLQLLKGDSYCDLCKVTGCLRGLCAKFNAAEQVYLSLLDVIESSGCYCSGCQQAIAKQSAERYYDKIRNQSIFACNRDPQQVITAAISNLPTIVNQTILKEVE